MRCSATLAACALTFLAIAVHGHPAYADEPSPAPSVAPITVSATTSLAGLAKAAADRFDAAYPGTPVVVRADGSRAALRALGSGLVDVALSDVATNDSAQIGHRIAVLPFAIVVDPATHVTNLTREQFADVLRGKIRNWKEVGGADVPVAVVSRGAHSGVWQLVARKILGGAEIAVAPASVAEATGTALSTLSRAPGGVSVVALAAARAAPVTVVSLDGASPDDAHVADGTYGLWAYEYAVTQGAPSTLASRFLAVLESDRAMLHALGFLSVRDLGAGALAP